MNQFSHIELNEGKFSEETLKYILTIQNTYLECTLFQKILDPRIKYEDLDPHIEFLKERLSHLEFFVDYTDVTFDNKIPGYSQYKYVDGQKIDDSWVITDLTHQIQNFSKELFWADKEEMNHYKTISCFDCFEEKLVPKAKMFTALANAAFFNVDSWIQYYQDLLDLKFPDFSQKLVLGKKIIKYRPFKGSFYLGIETDYQSCKTNFRKGKWEEPEYKLIIFKKVTDKKIENIVVFNKFVHPFFNPPVFSFEKYRYAENSIKVSELEFSLKYMIEKEFLENDMVKMYISEEFGDLLKQHAYFYYDLLHHTTKEFINFIEESFEDNEI
ncbi:hypothetical protein [Chryseobacterium sp. c4a]|uniref:hypothetical protein n=1 Tax=Chryseobacterium sp. c4a TaxID=1573582 RepID=UPI001356AD87|nr:hypothetical protein [Chryseobacterium sp. c4a]